MQHAVAFVTLFLDFFSSFREIHSKEMSEAQVYPKKYTLTSVTPWLIIGMTKSVLAQFLVHALERPISLRDNKFLQGNTFLER